MNIKKIDRDNSLKNKFYAQKVIPAISDIKNIDEENLKASEICFVLRCKLLDLEDIIFKLKSMNKIIFVHLDLIEGLQNNTAAIDYLIDKYTIRGIISTKENLLKYAKEKYALSTIYRSFLIDSISLASLFKNLKEQKSIDFIEILPIPSIELINELKSYIGNPFLVSGLIRTKKQIIEAVESGALACSVSNYKLWNR